MPTEKRIIVNRSFDWGPLIEHLKLINNNLFFLFPDSGKFFLRKHNNYGINYASKNGNV